MITEEAGGRDGRGDRPGGGGGGGGGGGAADGEAAATALPAEVRRERMLGAIVDAGFARVGRLSADFGVSEVTVRADLAALERAQAVRRVRGGAMPRAGIGLREASLEESQRSAAGEKEAIARRAAALVAPGMSVVLDVGSTCLAVARELVARDDLYDVTVITNGLAVALELENAIPRLQVVVTGGTLRPLQHSLVAPLASAMFERVRADLAVLGCNGVDAEAGVTNVNLPEAELKRAMLRACARAVVVADGSKAGQVHLGRVGGLHDFEAVYLGASAEPDAVARLERSGGAEIVRVGEPAAGGA